MGRSKGHRRSAKAALLALALATALLALAPSAFAAPAHLPTPDLDVEGLNHACGAAVDSEGNVYASSAGEGKIKVYAPGDHDTPIAEIANANEPCGLAVNSKGILLVSERATGNVVAYGPDAFPLSGTPTFSPAATIDAGGDAEGIAIDRSDDRLFVAEGDHVAVYRSEAQQVSVSGATGGTYKLKFEGQETAPIPFNATAAEVKAALEALSTIGPGEISISNSKRVTFVGTLGYTDVAQLEAISSLQGNEIQKVTVNATTGTYKLKFEGEETAAIAFNAPASAPGGPVDSVQEALEALANIAPGDVSVVGGPGDTGGTKPYLVTFEGAYAATNVGTMSSIAGGLAGGSAAVASASQFQTLTVSATGGTYKLKFEGQETAPIPFNATAAELKAALEALANIAPGDVSVVGGPGDAEGTRPYLVHFEGAYATTDVPVMTRDVSALTGTASVSRITSGAGLGTSTPTSGGVGTGETQGVNVTNALSGTYKLKFGGEETAPIAFNAKASEPGGPVDSVQEALEALANIAPGDVSVFFNGTPTFASRSYAVGFGGAYAATDVPQIEAISSLGPGGAAVTASTTAAGWSGRALEGQLTEATGVAAYTNANSLVGNLRLNLAVAVGAGDEVELYSGPASATALKLRKTITGVDHDGNPGTAEQEFSFGAAGAYLAADPGNEDTPSKGCIQVQVGGLDQACTQGHLFLHDAGNDAIYEFDTTGELFAQITAAGLSEDGEPTQVAVERSGGANDGTLYVSTGKEAGAALLAFAPVLEPSRPPLIEPFSKVLSDARAVATDCEGYVYVAAQSSVRVYSPAGSEVTSFTEANAPLDLAVDCSGHVYVVDTTGTPQMTYYSPSSYPPTGATTYGRQAPSLLTAAGLQGVAVNPANDHVFVLGNSSFVPVIREFGPPSGGSTAVGECGSGLGLETGRLDIDVYGKNGNVYVSAGPERVYVLKCGTVPLDAELIREVKGGGGCPSGDWGGSPRIAVDQSNGHFIEYANNQPGAAAREHDAAGACLAEFGTFSFDSGGYRLAIDNSCALHDLTESTTPTCADTYPSNGIAYVAWDGPDDVVQPYDVSAFGPLEYPEVEGPEESTLKVNLAGSGTGTVTSSPSGISCGATCEADFEEGTPVTLTGSPGANSKPVVWSGCDSVDGENKCLVSMDEAKEVTATFDLEQHLLSVSKTGSGTGKVTSSPPGIDCGSECDELYDHNTVVTLSPDPDPGSEFTGFSGACTGTGTCEVTMSTAKSVTANFDPESTTPEFLLSVDVEGTGSGTVTADQGLIACDPVCTEQYPEGTVVVLTATADPGSIFYSWKGCDSGGVHGRQCTLTMSEAKTVKATFTTTHALEVSKAPGSGLGKVQSSPGGVLCLNNCSETSASFKEGTQVTLKQTPAKHFHFVEWLGDCSGTDPCEPTMGEDHEVSAKFAEDAKHLLTITKTGGGQGTVKAKQAGINCGATCSTQAAAYYQGEVIELLVPTPGKGSTFGGWSGCDSEPEGKCLVTMSGAKGVVAEFE